jgi:hypothetical protein
MAAAEEDIITAAAVIITMAAAVIITITMGAIITMGATITMVEVSLLLQPLAMATAETGTECKMNLPLRLQMLLQRLRKLRSSGGSLRAPTTTGTLTIPTNLTGLVHSNSQNL